VRPEWDNIGSDAAPNVIGSELILRDNNDNNGEGQAIARDFSADLDEEFEMEATIRSTNFSDTGGAQAYVAVFSETLNFDNNNPASSSFRRPERSYIVRIQAGDPTLERVDDAGDNTALITSDEKIGTEPMDIRVTRDGTGEFELFVNGDSEGTSTDTTHDDPQHVFIQNRGGNEPSNELIVDEVRWS